MDKFQTFLLMAREIETEINEELNTQKTNSPALHVNQTQDSIVFGMSKEVESYLESLNNPDKMNSEIDDIYQNTLRMDT